MKEMKYLFQGSRGKKSEKCDYHMQALYGDGRGKNLNREWLSGSESERRKQKNFKQYVFEIAKRKNSRESVLLVENYYHELAVSYISDRLGEDSYIWTNLKRSKKRTGIKEENYMRLCTGI